jgi:hypothetical protein
MRIWTNASRTILGFGSALFFTGAAAHAQQIFTLKSGERAELPGFWSVTNCKSNVVGKPEVEILEGPEELTLVFEPAMLVPRRLNCAKPVPGGKIIATAKDVEEQINAKLTYRIKFKTKDGDRQESHVYNVSIFP